MAGQTTMNGQHATQSPAAKVKQNIAGLAGDLVSLLELQCQLTACDAREVATKSRLPLFLIGGSIVLALGCVPVFLMGLSWAIVSWTGISLPLALVLVGGAALVVAASAAVWGLNLSKQALAVFKRSYCELLHNLDWIKKVFLQQAERDANRFRCN
jgi:uncharacterized membrane protein YqjE